MGVPSPPPSVEVVAGNATIQVKWKRPTSNGGKAIRQYLVEIFHGTGPTAKNYGMKFTDEKTFAWTFTKLPNGIPLHAKVFAQNADGYGDGTNSADVTCAVPPPTVTVTLTKIGPNKIPNTRPGQSLADAPKIALTGTNLGTPWSWGSANTLEWVLYTNTSFNTVVGTDHASTLVTNQTATGMLVSAPVAVPAAVQDANHLIGPWRLKATYVHTPSTGATAVAYSPAIYTTAVGTIIIGTVSPTPAHDGDTVTLTGPDLGVCTTVAVNIGGNTINAPLTRVDQNTVTFVMPTFGYPASASGDLTATYVLNGNTMTTPPASVLWDPLSGGSGDTGGTYTPPQAAPVGEGDYGFPLLIHRWKFTDPDNGDSYEFTRNPAQMTSPFAARQVTSKHATAISGKVFLYEGAPVLANWQFSGIVKNAAAYETLRHWVEDRNGRTIVEDHFGRQIECVLLGFDARPHNDSRRYWSHDYTISALVLNVGAPTEVPAPS